MTNFDIMDGIIYIVGFVRSLIKFLFQAVVSILAGAGNLFKSIFTGELFGYFMDCFNYLSILIGSTGATILMGLFGFSFMLMVYSFIMRLIKGRVNDHNTIISYKKLPK